MCGPFCFYKDYIAFVDGSNYASLTPASTETTGNGDVLMTSCRNGAGRAMSSSHHQSLHSDEVSMSDGRSGTNSHRFHRPGGLVPLPPAPGVS